MELKIKEIIKAHGYTLTDVAERVNKSPQSLNGLLKNGNPSVKTLQDIANAIGCNVRDFFPDNKESNPDTASITCPYCGKTINLNIDKEKE